MNILEVIGNLGKDPETRYTQSGLKVTTLTIASNTKRGGKDETTWYRVTLWADKFDKILTYLKKGSLIMVIGELHKPEIFTNRDGKPQIGLEMTAEAIRFLPSSRSDKPAEERENFSQNSPSNGGQEFSGATQGTAQAPAGNFTSNEGYSSGSDDGQDIPF